MTNMYLCFFYVFGWLLEEGWLLNIQLHICDLCSGYILDYWTAEHARRLWNFRIQFQFTCNIMMFFFYKHFFNLSFVFMVANVRYQLSMMISISVAVAQVMLISIRIKTYVSSTRFFNINHRINPKPMLYIEKRCRDYIGVSS